MNALYFAHLNAILNATSVILLLMGWSAIRQRKVKRHRVLMSSALICSVLFLISYLIRYSLSGVHRYPGEGWDKIVYLTILITHTPLAACVPVLAVRTLYLALKGRFESHRKWARVTFPIWMYVSVTGVLIYWMLYHYAAIPRAVSILLP